MFTGIVKESAAIIVKNESPDGLLFEIQPEKLEVDLKLGDSISVDGVCLTITELKKNSFMVEATPETLRKTNLDDRESGDKVNLESAARLKDFLGGHLVQGHVDSTGEVCSVRTEGNSKVFYISATPDVMRYCVMKGSITVNGVSLTISGLDGEGFEVTVIPHTLEVTNFSNFQIGDRVNLEADIMSKYVESHVSSHIQDYVRRLGKLVIATVLSSGLLLAETFTIIPNTLLIYGSQAGNQKMGLRVHVARYRPDIVLEWESLRDQGTVHMFRKAVEEGQKFTLDGLFEVGVDMESPETTTVWLSEEIYNELVEVGVVKIRMNRLSVQMKLRGEGTYSLKIDQKVREIPVIHVEDNRKRLWTFQRDSKNPILVECVFPYFQRSLKSVSTASGAKFRWIRQLPTIK